MKEPPIRDSDEKQIR
jgi:hypothetical protein